MSKGKNQKPNVNQPCVSDLEEAKNNHLERGEFVYERISGWIENADNKVSVSCGIFTFVFGVISFLAEQFIKAPENSEINECWHFIYKGCFCISLILFAVAVFFYAWAIIPNLKSNAKKKSRKEYPIYYGDIQSIGIEEYKKLMENGNEKEFINELYLESWVNSRICMKKMKRYRIGVVLSLISIAFALLSLFGRFLMYR